MKFDLDQHVISFDGKPVQKTEEDDTPITLGEVLTQSCVSADPTVHTDHTAKMQIYRVLQKVSGDGEVELKSEEITLLKELVGAIFGVVVVGPVIDILEQEDDEPPELSEVS